MRVSLHRTISLVLLLVALLTLSGLTTAAAALVHADTATACCDKERNDGQTGAVPCSAPDCSCISCMTIDLVDSPTIHRAPLGEALHFTPAQRFHLSEYLSSIDYPPEITNRFTQAA